ncbi:MAG: DUF554 domain-containing protein [Syntrophobacterales bacterium]|jgi:uncharacterized membrane protein YqgA involved in biofilm formation|nr:DUF554 domain-containing protein [Syntrophobacterales bacterium]
MTGTLVNCVTIILGSIIGLRLAKHIPERFREIMIQALGLSTLFIGFRMAVSHDDTLPVVISLLAGGIIGEWIDIEGKIEKLGEWMKMKLASQSATFSAGFVTASVLYLSGPMMIVGSLRDGTVGDSSILFLKALLDGVASIALASFYGVGVICSVVPVLLIQGSISVAASYLLFLQTPQVLGAITAAGGVLVIGIGLNLLNITKIRIGNFLFAFVIIIAWKVMAG